MGPFYRVPPGLEDLLLRINKCIEADSQPSNRSILRVMVHRSGSHGARRRAEHYDYRSARGYDGRPGRIAADLDHAVSPGRENVAPFSVQPNPACARSIPGDRLLGGILDPAI